MTSEEGLGALFAARQHQHCGGHGTQSPADIGTGSGNRQHRQPVFFLSRVILGFAPVLAFLVASHRFVRHSLARA